MPDFSDFYYPSSNGVNSIHARVCKPIEKPKAIIQIVHGIAEHINRYDDFMLFLAEHGYVVCGEDHLGHGKSFTEQGDMGFFADRNGWDRVVDDIHTLRGKMVAEYPDTPFILFGHSMGSFLTRTFLIRYPKEYFGAIISGTGQQSPVLVATGKTIAELIVKFKGPRADGTQLNDIAFSSYNDKIDNKRTDFDWLSRDNAQVDRYIEDPLCGFVAKASLYWDMMTGIQFISSAKNAAAMNKNAPIYFMSGACDPVGDYGKGVDKAYTMFCKVGMKDVFLRLYPGGRHEMLNETNRADVYNDILKWLNEKVK